MDLEQCEEVIFKKYHKGNIDNSSLSSDERQELSVAYEALQEFGTKVSPDTERDAIELAKILASKTDMDYMENIYKAFPQNPEVILDNELKNDKKTFIRTVLYSDKLDIYQLNTCSRFDKNLVKEILTGDKELYAKVEQMFGNPKDFAIIESAYKTGQLNDIVDMEAKYAQVKENLQNLSGKEVYDILRTDLTDIPEYNKAEKLYDAFAVIGDYYRQTLCLSCRMEKDSDLFYTAYKTNPNGEHLDLIGKFANLPEIEKLIEEKIGKMYSYFSYPALDGNEDAKERYHQVEYFIYTCKQGGDEFAKNMKKELLKNPFSAKSDFYVKYALGVLAQHGCEGRYSDTITEIIPQIIMKRPEVCETLINGMKQDKKYLSLGKEAAANILKEWKENPDSEISKLYSAHIQDIFGKHDGYYVRGYYADVINEVLSVNKEKYPQFCKKLCDNLVEMYKDADMGNVNPEIIRAFAEAYSAYPSADMEKSVTECLSGCSIYDEDLLFVAEAKEKTGLQIFDTIMDETLEHYKQYVGCYGHALKIDGKPDASYRYLFAKLNEKDVQAVNFTTKDGNYTVDCADIEGNTSLTYIDACATVKFKNAEKLLTLPNIKTLRITLKAEEAHKLYKILLHEKPQNLHKLGDAIRFTPKESEALMKKYPDLLAGNEYNKWTHRNQTIIEVLDNKYSSGLLSVAKEGFLAEYLSVLPKEKRPSFNELAKVDEYWEKCPLDYLKSPAEEYYEKLYKIADVLEAKDIKDYLKLRIMYEKGKLMEFLQNAKPEKLPKLESFCVKNRAFGNKSIFDLLDDEEDKFKILKIMNVNEKDAKRLSKLDGMSEAVAQWQEQQKMDKADAAAQAAFKAWQESKGIKK